jgi:MFS family permease
VASGLGLLIVGYSLFEGVGSALMIPPIYILATLYYDDVTSRARAFGVISGMGGIGAAAGPLIGGLITTAISWRASFLLQAVIVGAIIVLSRRLTDPVPADPKRPFDLLGAILSAAGMAFLVIGILQAGTNTALTVIFFVAGAAVLLWFFVHIRSRERAGREPLLSDLASGNRSYALAMLTLAGIGLIGLAAALLLPGERAADASAR